MERKIVVARKRRENESYEKYKENLKKESMLLKLYLKGRIWWQSHVRGTYYRGNKR